MKLLTFLFAVLISFAVNAQTCGEACLSNSDKQVLAQANETVEAFARDGERYIPELQRVTASTGEATYRRFAKFMFGYAEEFREYRRKTKNVSLRKVFGRYAAALEEYAEFVEAGAVLAAAKNENNISLLRSAASAYRSDDAKELIAPLTSLVEVQARGQRFIRMIPGKTRAVQEQVISASSDLFDETGIEYGSAK